MGTILLKEVPAIREYCCQERVDLVCNSVQLPTLSEPYESLVSVYQL